MAKSLNKHNYHGIDATIIADSKNEHGQRITSFVCTFPRIVLAEFNTHRMLSRNSASSRAVPFKKMVKQIEDHPFIPIKWMKDHKGMQGDEYFTDSNQIESRKLWWLANRDDAVASAKQLSYLNVTKQFVNRLLEPFKWHTVIVTATSWQNFFALRAHEAAEIHIQKLAFKMLEEYNNSEPKQLKAGEWHIPFGDQFDEDRIYNLTSMNGLDKSYVEKQMIKIATARCARVSYENFDGSDDYQKDINLHDRLASMGHWSPFEHCARAMDGEEFATSYRGHLIKHYMYDELGDQEMQYVNAEDGESEGWSGNFRGFIQYRKMFENENQTDERVE